MAIRQSSMSIRDPMPLGTRHFHGLRSLPETLEADACVIGSGASGAVAADALVACGWSVVMIEEGSLLRRNVRQEEADEASPMAEVRGDVGWEERGWPWSTRNVGGGTLFYGGASFRYLDCDFDATRWLPGEGLDVAWPIELSELAPFYEVIERRLKVSGGRTQEPAGGRGRAMPMSLPGELMAEAGRRLAYQPFPTPLAVDSRACSREDRCMDFQCPSGAKGDVVRIYLKRLAADSRFTLVSGVRGLALEQERPKRVASLRCLDLGGGAERRVRAHHFFVAGNAIQSAALLLRSVTPFAPNGVGNRHDLVGRGLCMKLSQYVRGTTALASVIDRLSNHPVGLSGPFSTVAFLDHYLDMDCPGGMGGLIYESRTLAPPPKPWRQLPLELEIIMADTPAFANRIRLSPNLDSWGVPKIAIDYRLASRDMERLAYMAGRAERILREAGVGTVQFKRSRSEHGSTHLHGTCRSGVDPARSVLDPYCRIHDIENVHVIDGSFMPFPGGLNPTLTIQANALRVALHVAGAWGS